MTPAERDWKAAYELQPETAEDWKKAYEEVLTLADRLDRGWEDVAQTYANEIERLRQQLDAAVPCAELLIRLVRPMYSGPTGDQGLNDPLYGECLQAIRRYRDQKAASRGTDG